MRVRTTLLLLALCCVATAAAFASDPLAGTWKLNEAKSKVDPGAPKNHTVIYEPAGDEMKVIVEGTDSSGASTRNEWTGKFDGKEYPVTGDATSDMRSYTKVNDHTVKFTGKKDGKVTMTGRVTVSPDGKTRTVTTQGTNAEGKKVKATTVYEKQ